MSFEYVETDFERDPQDITDSCGFFGRPELVLTDIDSQVLSTLSGFGRKPDWRDGCCGHETSGIRCITVVSRIFVCC